MRYSLKILNCYSVRIMDNYVLRCFHSFSEPLFTINCSLLKLKLKPESILCFSLVNSAAGISQVVNSLIIIVFPVYVYRKMMSKQGLNPLFPMEDIAVMGIWELLPYLNQFRVWILMNICKKKIKLWFFQVITWSDILKEKDLCCLNGMIYAWTKELIWILKWQVRLKQTIEAALSFKPHVVLTVDAKGFSFRFLKHLRGNAL